MTMINTIKLGMFHFNVELHQGSSLMELAFPTVVLLPVLAQILQE